MPSLEHILHQGIAASPEPRASAEQHATRLARFHERVAACRLALERWHQQHGQESNYRVELDLELPG